jgi:opacity protein-like surface antigen
MRKLAMALAACAALLAPAAMAAPVVAPKEGDFVVRDFKFRSGETLPELRLHYTTFGEPKRDAAGHVTSSRRSAGPSQVLRNPAGRHRSRPVVQAQRRPARQVPEVRL